MQRSRPHCGECLATCQVGEGAAVRRQVTCGRREHRPGRVKLPRRRPRLSPAPHRGTSGRGGVVLASVPAGTAASEGPPGQRPATPGAARTQSRQARTGNMPDNVSYFVSLNCPPNGAASGTYNRPAIVQFHGTAYHGTDPGSLDGWAVVDRKSVV